MSVLLNINGTDYPYPEPLDLNWGQDATDWAIAVTAGMLQKAGGAFTLLGETDFGPNFGLKSLYYKSRATNPSSTGIIRLGNAENISWRNQANSADLALTVNSSNQLIFNGSAIGAISSVLSTNSIQMGLSFGVLTSDVKLSAAAASAGNILSNLSIQSDGLRAQVPIMVGDSGAGGASGTVPSPITGDATKFLRGDGTWQASSSPLVFGNTTTINLTNTAGTITADVNAGSLTNTQISASAAIAYSKLNLSLSIVNADVSASAAIVYSKLSLSGSIVNADVSASAAIAYSKLSLASSIVNADISASAAIAYSKLALTGSIVNADVNASAAIARSKLAALTASRAMATDGSGFDSAATTTLTELNYVNGVTSAIQTQLDAKQLRSVLTAKGDIYAATASNTSTRMPAGVDGTFLQADSSQSTGLTYGNPSGTQAIRSVTTTDAPSATTDTTLVCSGANFTITFPTPSSGKIYRVVHNGTSLTQVYTLATTGGANIGGVASGSYVLRTNGETLEIQYNGTNFIILEHQTSTDWTNAGTISLSSTSSYTFTITSATVVAGDTYTNNGQTFTVTSSGTVTSMPASGTGAPAASGTLTKATGSGPATLTFSAVASSVPVKGTNNVDRVDWRREGVNAIIRYRYSQTVAGTAGTGDYIFFIPTNLVANTTTVLTPYVASVGTYLGNVYTTGPQNSFITTYNFTMNWTAGGSAVLGHQSIASLYSTTSFRCSLSWWSSATQTLANANFGNLSGAVLGFGSTSMNWNFTLVVPISGWQP